MPTRFKTALVPALAVILLTLAAATAHAQHELPLVGHIGGTCFAVDGLGSYVFMREDSAVRALDVTDPANPVPRGQVVFGDLLWGVCVSGSYAYVAAGECGLRVVNVMGPANPSEAGSYDTPGSARDVSVSGSWAYVADFTSGLRVIDISDPAHPTEAGFYDTSGEAQGVYMSGNHAYIADHSGGLRLGEYAPRREVGRAGSLGV